MTIHIIGGGWVTAGGYGRIKDGSRPIIKKGPPLLPPADELFIPLPARFRRFDMFTRLGLSAIALALRDAGMDKPNNPRPVGIVISSIYECYEVDLAYYQTALEEDGLYASPNLFSYTLPGIVSGEAAIYYQLTGPTFTVGDDLSSLGLAALITGVGMLRSGMCETIICGWLDSPGDLLEAAIETVDPIRGAVFVVLSVDKENSTPAKNRINGLDLVTATGKGLLSIIDLF